MTDVAQQLAEIERRMQAEMPAWLEQMHAAIGVAPPGDQAGWEATCEALRQQAHRIRGRAAMLGMHALATAAGEVESMCRFLPAPAELSAAVARCIASG